MQRIVQVLRIDAGRTKVIDALTRRAQLAEWWTRQVSGSGAEGEILRFEFEGDFNPEMSVIEVTRPKRVVWKCASGAERWQGDTFVFELREKGDATILKFVQEYTRHIDEESFGVFNHNWGYYLNSLRLYCETGTGTPFDDGQP